MATHIEPRLLYFQREVVRCIKEPTVVSSLEADSVISQDDSSRIKTLYQNGESFKANENMIDCLLKSRSKGRWRSFLDALERSDYHYLKSLLESTRPGERDERAREIIRVFTPYLEQRISAKDIVTELYSKKVISEIDKEEILAIYQNKGETYATIVLLERMQCRLAPDKWYYEFLSALVKNDFKDVVEEIEPDFLVYPDRFRPSTDKIKLTDPTAVWNDPRTIELYETAIQEGKERDKTVRIMVIGCYEQGKSSLVRRLSGQSLKGVKSTHGVDVHICKSSSEDSNIWEIKHPNDISDESVKRLVSVARSDHLQNSLLDEPSENTSATGVSMGIGTSDKLAAHNNMTTLAGYDDSRERKPNRKRYKPSSYSVEKFKTEMMISNSATNTQNDKSLDFNIWDFGGQFVYYATHQLFHARQAIYILVFNIAKGLDADVLDDDHPNKEKKKTMAEYLKFWVSSVHTFVGNEQGTEPPIFLVGTHLDKLEEHIDIDDSFEEVRKLFDDTSCADHIQEKHFAVSNTNPNGHTLTEIRSALTECYEKQSKDQFVPAKWIPLEGSLKENRHLKIISFEKVKEIDSKNEFPVNSEEQLKIFLQYHHEKGTFFYFESEDDDINHIVLEPKFLIDAFRCIITSEKMCRVHPKLRKSWNRLCREAILERELLRELWRSDPEMQFMKFEKTLVFFLQRHRIIAEALEFEDDSLSPKPVPLDFYIVPSLLEKSADRVIEDFLRGKRYTKVSYGYLFEYDAVLCTIYNRVTAAILGRWPVLRFQGKSLIYENVSACKINISHTGLLKMLNSTLELLVVSLCPGEDVSGDVCDTFRRFVEMVIEQELHKFRRNHGNAFKIKVRCHHVSHGYSGSLDMYKIETLRSCNKDLIGCPDHCSHAIHIRKALNEWLGTEIGSVVIPKRELTEKELSRFSTAIGKNWEHLARELGFPEAEIEQVCLDKPTTPLQIYEILKRWRTKCLDGGTLDILVKAVQECSSFITVNNDALKNLIDGIL